MTIATWHHRLLTWCPVQSLSDLSAPVAHAVKWSRAALCGRSLRERALCGRSLRERAFLRGAKSDSTQAMERQTP